MADGPVTTTCEVCNGSGLMLPSLRVDDPAQEMCSACRGHGTLSRTTVPQPLGPDQLVLAYLLDAVKYLVRQDHDSAQRSLEHAQSHFRRYHLSGAAFNV